METLLLSYDETPYVSEAYRVALEGVGGRGQMLAGLDMPAELPQWLETLGHDSVRALSVTLVIDLLRIEDRPEYAEALVQDVLGLVEDLLLAGDFDLARGALRELRARASTGVAPAAARAALTTCGESMALREAGLSKQETRRVFRAGPFHASCERSAESDQLFGSLGSISLKILSPAVFVPHILPLLVLYTNPMFAVPTAAPPVWSLVTVSTVDCPLIGLVGVVAKYGPVVCVPYVVGSSN